MSAIASELTRTHAPHVASNNIIGIPANDAEFEEKCVVLFSKIVGDPNFKRVATSGKNQGGIDLIGARDRDPRQPVGVQCKLRTTNAKLTEAEIRSDVGRALEIIPNLTEVYVVTTASDDLSYDKLSLTIRQEQIAEGRNVDIQIWGWGTMQARIRRDPDILRAFDPNYSAFASEVLSIGVETLEVAQDTASSVTEVLSQNAVIASRLSELVALTQPDDSQARSRVDKVLDEQVDDMRNLLNSGRPKTALDLLERLEAKLTSGNSNAIRARVRANIGFAHLKLGNDAKAAALLQEAYEINPDDPKIRANRLLSLILTDDATGAYDGAREILSDDPTNAAAASLAYQAAANLSGSEDPDTFVSDALLNDENVAINRVGFLRNRGRTSWRLAAAETREKHPDSRTVGRFAAEALLEEAYGADGPELEPASQAERRRLLEDAIAILKPHWNEVRSYENASEPSWLMVGLNLFTAYRATRNAEGVRAVADQLLDVAPNDPDVLVAAAHADLIEDQSDKVLARLGPIADTPQRTLLMVIALTEKGAWQEIVDFTIPERRLALAPFDRQLFDTLVLRARLEVGDVSNPEAAIQGLIDEWPDSTTISITALDLAYRFRSSLTEGLVTRSRQLVSGETGFRDRVMLAELSLRNDDYETVILALDGYVETDRDSEPLAWLALAFANSPTRPRTHAFFESLSEELLGLSRYARLAGAAENARGDLPLAVRHLRRAIKDDPTDLRAHLLLQIALERDNRRSAAATAIREIDENRVVGTPLELMRLAMMLRRHGQGSRAIALGYKIASENRDDEEIVSSYPGLVFFNEDLPAEVAVSGQMAVGCWFELEGIDVTSVAGIVHDGQTPGVDNYAPDHPLAKAILGKAQGDEITFQAALGPERHYKLKEVKHRYIWLLHDITRTHATRFPESTTMGEMSLREGDIQPVLDIARQHSTHHQSILDAYANLTIPLEVLAGLNHRSVLAVAELIPQLGGEIRTSIGSGEEREAATRAVRKAAGRGAALDTITAWRAYHFDFLPALKSHFGRLIIAQSTIDELIKLRDHEELNVGQEYITLGMEGDQPVRQIHTPEETAGRIAVLEKAISTLKTECEVQPVDGTDDSDLQNLVNRDVIQTMLDPVLLAQQHDLFLLSEDLYLRQIASRYIGNRSGWLQAVAMALRELKLISLGEYALTVGRLAAWKHDHVSLNGETLVEMIAMNHPQAEGYFDAAIEYIGGPKAEMGSHTVAVADFMIHVWGTQIPSWKKGSAIGRLLMKLIQNRGNDWPQVFDNLAKAIRQLAHKPWGRPDLALRYLRDWIVGHFLHAGPPKEPKKKKAK